MKKSTRFHLAYLEYKKMIGEIAGYVPLDFQEWKKTSVVARRIQFDYAD